MASSEQEVERATDTLRRITSGDQDPVGRWVSRGFVGLLLAIGIAVAFFSWPGSSGDAAKNALPQPVVEPASQIRSEPTRSTPVTAINVPASPDWTPQFQSMGRDLAGLGKTVEQLKAGQEGLVRDNESQNQQFKTNLEQLSREVARLSEQLGVTQAQVARDSGAAADQIKGIQDQLARLTQAAAEQKVVPKPEQNAAPKVAATPLPPKRPRARRVVAAAPAPGQPVPPRPAAARPKPQRPQAPAR